LIAARLQGRTANDVKNYWNAHLRNKVVSGAKEKKEKEKPKEIIKAHEVIKPRPLTFSTHSPWLNGKHNFVTHPILGNVPRYHDASSDTMVPDQIGRDCASDSQPNLGNASILCVQCGCSSLQEQNYKVFKWLWLFLGFQSPNHCDFDSL